MASFHSFDLFYNDGEEILLAKWTIQNFSDLTETIIESQKFSHKLSAVKWRLQLFPEIMFDGQECVKIILAHELPIPVQLKLTMILDTYNDSIMLANIPPILLRSVPPNGIFCCFNRTEIINNYLQVDGSLVFVVCMDFSTVMVDQAWTMSRVKRNRSRHRAWIWG